MAIDPRTITTLITKITGPVLLLRALSIVIDRPHFTAMVGGLDHEINTISFSFFPIALLMGGIAIAVLHSDRSSLAAVLLRLMAWGAIAKASALILVPRLVAAKAVLLEQAGFLNVVLLVSLTVGAYFTWFGYFAPADLPRSAPAPNNRDAIAPPPPARRPS